ncbi:hypothetical protein ACFE04_010254 [Oxalis oulophora]
MSLNLGEEMKLLKIELLQLQQCVEKKALKLNEAKDNLNEAKHNLNEATQNLYETKHRVSTLLGKIITLQKPLTELEMFKDLYIKQTEEMRSLKSRVQLQEQMEKQCSEIEEVQQVIPTQHIEDSSFTAQLQDLSESLAQIKKLKDCMRLQHLKYMEKKKKGFYIKQSKQAILIPGSLKSIRKTVTKALGFHGQLLKSSDSPKKTNAGRWPMAALQPSRSVGSRNHDDGLGCSSSSSKKTNMGGKAMVLQHSRSDGSDRASWKKCFELF